jgi:hypothetical protein
MSESFSVGEVATWVREGSPNYGREVTIAGQLEWVNAFQPDGSREGGYRYQIDAPWMPLAPHGEGWCAKPEWLRKRPPKQDWNSLCHLTDLPREVTHA